MDKITFENATLVNPAKVTIDGVDYEVTPEETSGGTPASANTFNTMQENIEKSVVAISKTQPSTSENVWIKKGKNLFNKNAVLKNCELLNNGADVGYNELWFVSDYIEVEPNTIYYLSGNRTGGTTNAFYDENKTFISYVSKITGDITTPSNAKYIRFNGKLSEIDNNIMLEQNLTATTFEPYVGKEILIKNDNGVFEEFYSEENLNKENYSLGEQRIGTWISGKPLYRKVVDFGTLPNNTSKRVNHGLSNAKIVKIAGSVVSDTFAGAIPNGHPTEPLYYWVTNTYIEVISVGDRSSYTGYFIIEYTKTTD